MSDGIYTTLTRQSGLMREMSMVANNVANASTTGYRAEGLIFSEHVKDLGEGQPSLSMATGNGHVTRSVQGALSQTNGTYDLAIEGDGFFQVEGSEGEIQLTRAGAFLPNDAGDLVTPEGLRVLDAGGAPIFIPPDVSDVHISSDGTLSADGRLLAQIGLVMPEDINSLDRTNGVSFTTDGALEPVENGRVLQGFLEGSNVDAVSEISRMIQVQHAYQMGQGFMEREDERMRSVTQLIGR